MRRSIRPDCVEVVQPKVELPAEWKDGKILETCSIKEVPTEGALAAWLKERGLDTSDWGQGNTKPVKKLWLELKDSESGLELWQTSSGERRIVRVTHVLRAKVCSPESHKRRIFLFNTWQQYGDGRQRVRNGLLSEKLTTEEMPLEKHLHEVCSRAVTQEEMQRVTEALFKLTPGAPPPAYDPKYKCPIQVVDEYFCDHVVEVEASKSYPRLTTMYHLYTVEILCNGLPTVDFNTLEFDHPDAKGYRKLKYVHAWVWKEWAEVQRYLFEGSVLKERKSKGSFATPASLTAWLELFNLDLSSWGQKGNKSVGALFRELEAGESQLEMWGRNDGVPLLMRVVHVLQLKVGSQDPRLKGKFLYNTDMQTRDGTQKSVNRLMSTKLSTRKVPFDQDRFEEETKTGLSSLLGYIVDSFYRLEPDKIPKVETLEKSMVSLSKVELVDHHVDVDMSPAFKGLCTLYHIYTCNASVEGLPSSSFSSFEVSRDGTAEGGQASSMRIESLLSWCWCTWPQCLDMVHNRHREMDDQLEADRGVLESKAVVAGDSLKAAQELQSVLGQLKKASSSAKSGSECKAMEALTSQLLQTFQDMTTNMDATRSSASRVSIKRTVPPAIVSELAEKTMIAQDSISIKGDI